MEYINSSYVQDGPTLKLFIGDTVTISFEFNYSLGNPINLLETGVEVLFTLCPYGQYDYPVLRKKMDVSQKAPYNRATVLLTIDDTKNLEDTKYNYQPILTYVNSDGFEREFLRMQGDVLMLPRIRHELLI